MAGYGALIALENGNPFITPQSTPFCLYRKVTVNSANVGGSYQGASMDIPIDASYPAIVFCKTSNAATVGATRVGNMISVGSSSPRGDSHTLTAYVFAIFPQTLPAWGMAIWDENGKLVLTNESRVLSDLVTVGTPGNGGGINIDQTLSGSYAIVPALLGSSLFQVMVQGQPVIVNVTAYAGALFNGTTTRINAQGSQTGQGSAVGGTNTGMAITAINTAAYD
ncbi:hypothetical protein LVQ79_10835 [Buttiauxella sp. A2-C1_F]|uniref:hypothetical protein n=1 Tax=Buttiauxella sp. A2-C1_F TaxID=2904526 RepID=UPI001E5E6A2B|nr:hypothetical protein [Buttiauxella sp. A2-C1_F]MCE0846041.1 hypothetical protein [Buttiauxella sp. A2-C1_F]